MDETHRSDTGTVQVSCNIANSRNEQRGDLISHLSSEDENFAGIENVDKRPVKRLRKLLYQQKFRDEWLQDRELKTFITRCPLDSKSAYCKYCKKRLKGSVSVLKKHATCQSHVKSVNATKEEVHLDLFTSAISAKQLHANKVTNAELRLATYFAVEDLPILKMNSLENLVKSTFSDSEIASCIKIKRTKATTIISNVTSSYETKLISMELNNDFFFLIADESTDRSTKKSFVLIAKYVNENKEVKEEFLRLLEVDDAKAKWGGPEETDH
jgi:hypothetical protein